MAAPKQPPIPLYGWLLIGAAALVGLLVFKQRKAEIQAEEERQFREDLKREAVFSGQQTGAFPQQADYSMNATPLTDSSAGYAPGSSAGVPGPVTTDTAGNMPAPAFLGPPVTVTDGATVVTDSAANVAAATPAVPVVAASSVPNAPAPAPAPRPVVSQPPLPSWASPVPVLPTWTQPPVQTGPPSATRSMATTTPVQPAWTAMAATPTSAPQLPGYHGLPAVQLPTGGVPRPITYGGAR